MSGHIVGELSAIWTKEGDPDFDEVGEAGAKAGVRINFEDEEEFAEFIRTNLVMFRKVTVTPFLSVAEPQPENGGGK